MTDKVTAGGGARWQQEGEIARMRCCTDADVRSDNDICLPNCCCNADRGEVACGADQSDMLAANKLNDSGAGLVGAVLVPSSAAPKLELRGSSMYTGAPGILKRLLQGRFV